MPRKAKAPAAVPDQPKHDQNLRIDFDDQFLQLAQLAQHLARNNVRFLITHLALTHEFVLSFDQANGLLARALVPDIFPERKKKSGYYGESVYFKYISKEQIEARAAILGANQI